MSFSGIPVRWLPLGRNSGHHGGLTSQVPAWLHLKDSFF